MRRRLLPLALLAALGPGCTCQRKSEGVERWLPQGAAAVVVVPRLDALGPRLLDVSRLKVASFAAQLRGYPDAQAFLDTLVGEVGLDVRTPQALAAAGLDGARGLGAALLVPSGVVLVMPVKDEAAFEAALSRLARERLGLAPAPEVRAEGVVVRGFARGAAPLPQVGYVLREGYALVGQGEAVKSLVMVATQKPEATLAREAAYLALVKERPALVRAYLPQGSPALAPVPVPVGPVLASLSLSPTRLQVVVDGAWRGEAGALSALKPAGGGELSGVLPRDAFGLVRFEGNPGALGRLLLPLLGRYGRALKVPLTEWLPRVKPGAVASLSLPAAGGTAVTGALAGLSLRGLNPLDLLNVVGVAQVEGQDTALQGLQALAQAAPGLGARMEQKERDGQVAFLTTWALGEGVHFAPRGERIYFGTPVQRLRDVLAAAPDAGPPVAGLPRDALAAAVDLRALARAIEALPDGAWGLGGFAVKAATLRWLAATDDLLALTVAGGAWPAPPSALPQGVLGVTVELRLKGPGSR